MNVKNVCHAVCQTLRILSFTVTTLPSPNYHCRTGRDTAVAVWPRHWWGHVAVNLKKQVASSHSRNGANKACSALLSSSLESKTSWTMQMALVL